MAQYGLKEEAAQICRALFEVATLSGTAPPARTVLRVYASAPPGTDSLPGRLLTAGVGRGDALCDSCDRAWDWISIEGQCRSL